MRTALVVIGSLLTLGSVLPYIRDVVRSKTKPRIVSWFTWSLLTGISLAASLSDHAYASAALLAAATLATAIVVVLGLRFGDRTFERMDIICQVSALVGLGLWLMFDSPAIAVLASVAIDLVGALPTLKHTWQKPYEETSLTFLVSSVGAMFILLATTTWRVTTLAYPIYLVVINGLLGMVIVVRHRYVKPGEPAELREL